jgi:hypothetical protein
VNINDDWEKIKYLLSCHHSIFYKIVEIGKPCFSDKIPTAAVQFDKEGKFINFIFNEKFWEKCDDYKKMFVICHEAMHIILNHGTRFLDKTDTRTANIAMDVVVNHSLVRDFGFIRNEIDSKNEYCWVDTVFKDKKYLGFDYPDDESTEFYYNQIEKNKKDKNNRNDDGDKVNQDKQKDGSQGTGSEEDNKLVDSHEDLSNEDLEKVVNDVIDSLDNEEKKQFTETMKNIKDAGNALGGWLTIPKIKEVRKRKWETVIKQWEINCLKTTEAEREQWIKKSRRMSSFQSNLILPSTSAIECLHKDKNKINVFFFLDTSGSCINYAHRFFTAANSLPKDKFDIKLFCFDTCVVETDIKSSNVYGGGGTSFSIMEKKIQEEKLKTKKYPKAVFVITDGYGDAVKPEFPARWHWFLTDNYTRLIPSNSFKYDLKDFE